MNITLIYIYYPALPSHILLHHLMHVLVSLLQDAIFEAMVLTTLFWSPRKIP